MGLGGWPRLGGWSLSRRATAGLLAGASILSSRTGLDLLVATSELLDVALAGFLLYQVSVGEAVVGLHVAWVLIGYLVYAYTPELYLGQYGQIVEARGFRAITACVTVYFGIVVSRLLQTIPDAGAFALVADGVGGQLSALVIGAIASVFVFSGYILVWRGERFLAEDSIHFRVMERFTVDSQQDELRQLQTLPHPARTLAIAVNESLLGGIYLLPCLVLGFAVAVVNVFYPIPEGLVLVGFIVSYTPASARLAAVLPAQLGRDIEFRIADETTDAVQNSKGLTLTMFCVIALGFCGVAFVVGLAVLVGNAGRFLAVAIKLGGLGSVSLFDLARVLALMWFTIGLFLVLPLYGLYGLFYWFQQLKRLPPYVTFWEQYWREETRTPPSTSVQRPPGVFLPGDVLLVLAAGVTWILSDAELSLQVVVGFGLAWPVGVAIVMWSVYATFRGESQSLAHEGRDVIVAFLLQLVTLAVIGVLVGTSPFGSLSVAVLFSVLLIGGYGYWPEVMLYAERQEGVAAFVHVLYIGILCAFMLAGLATVATVPPVFPLVIVGLLVLWLLILRLETLAQDN